MVSTGNFKSVLLLFNLASPTVLKPTEAKTTQPELFAPLIIVPPKNLTAEKGDNVTLTCAAVGYPKPLIRYLIYLISITHAA